MNKKKLSVVMAGAMLASSVAPVLAAETKSEANVDQLGMLVQKVRNQLFSKLYTDTSKVAGDRNAGYSNTSVYGVKIDGVVVEDLDVDLTADGASRDIQNKLQDAFKGLTAGQKVEIFSRGFKEEGDKVYANGLQTKYTEKDFENSADALVKEINKGLAMDADGDLTSGAGNTNLLDNTHKAEFVAKAGDKKAHVKITFKGALTNVDGDPTTLEIKEGDTIVDFTKYLNEDSNPVDIVAGTELADIYGLAPKADSDLKYTAKYAEEKVEEITLVGGVTAYKTEDLYDGLMLTTKGHELLTILKEADDSKGKITYSFTTKSGKHPVTASTNLGNYKNEDGTVTFEITVVDNTYTSSPKTTTYTVTGSEKDTETVLAWLYNRDPKIDLLAGDNRYETAVSIAKEQVSMPELKEAENSNIVLVNGESLVDGLAAAPLASQLTYDADETAEDHAAAPILLTEADKLPKATKAYLKELVADKKIGEVKTTIHLVGGKSVLSKSLENELKSYGFKIERYNGDNREETSLKVAEAIAEKQGTTVNDEVFVVGSNGEADAMAIAPVASTPDNTNHNVTPIVVSKNNGISDDALAELDAKKVTVIGGEGVVSAEDYEAIKEAVGENGEIRRISGENRKATNAAIINTFYTDKFGTSEKVIVAKDGQNKKIELIDALTAANLAAQNKAPIVLATDSLSSAQINALELNAKTADNLYQVGHGVARDVVKTIAERLGLK